MTKFYRGGVSAVFSADADFKGLLGFASSFDTHFNELANAGLGEAGERVVANYLGVLIGWQERARVVPAKT